MKPFDCQMSNRPPTLNFTRSSYILVALATLVVLGWGILWWQYTIDDAYITFQYARNVAIGNGPVFNTGERVEGYSCPLWVFLLAGIDRLGVDVIRFSKVVGLLCAFSLPLLT